MAYSSRSFAGLVVLAVIFFSTAGPAKAISCTQALEYLMPCQPFLLGIGDISSACCLGAQALAHATASQTDRKSVCQCLKQVALSVNVNQKKAEQLPQLCNIDVPITIQPNVNCDAIPMSDVRFELNGYKNLESKAFRLRHLEIAQLLATTVHLPMPINPPGFLILQLAESVGERVLLQDARTEEKTLI